MSITETTITEGTATVSTDLLDYAPGSTANITASGFIIGSTLEFEVEHVEAGEDGVYGTADDVVVETSGDGHESWIVTDGGEGDLDGEANGTIVTGWYVNPDDSTGATFLLTATDTATGDTATTGFTDTPPPPEPVPADVPPELDNGIVFSAEATVAGTGVFPAFVQIQGDKEDGGTDYDNDDDSTTEEGFNTSWRDVPPPPLDSPVLDTDNALPHNHSIQLSDIPIAIVDGVAYRGFRLDLNESNQEDAFPIDLDALKLYWSTDGLLAALSGATEIYNMDGGTDGKTGGAADVDVSVGLNAWAPGSGYYDYKVLIPESYFAGLTGNPYIYVYSAFSDADSGFEEWASFEGFSISGYKWNDLSGDGIWDGGEPGLEDWQIYIDVNDNNLFDAGEPITLTAADGSWSFDVVPGSYTIREVLELGWTQTAPEPLPPGEFAVDVTDEDVTGLNFGNMEGSTEPELTLTGFKWEDLNGDGLWGFVFDESLQTFVPAEPGIEGWTIYLDTDIDPDNNDELGWGGFETTTGADGSYSFNVTLALSTTYYLYEAPDPDWTQTHDGGVIITVDAQGDVTTNPVGVIVNDIGGGALGSPTGLNGDDTEPFNFGNFENVDISGYKWEDDNGDGKWDDGETGYDGWKIFLGVDTDGDGDADATLDCYLTGSGVGDPAGYYEFLDLGPLGAGETYVVWEDPTNIANDEWTQTFGDDGYPVDPLSGNVLAGELGAGDGEDGSDGNFGNFENIDISGYKWSDTDYDGVWDETESGLAGWKIYLDDDGDFSNDVSTTTGADGSYSFENLGPGEYFVYEGSQPGWINTFNGATTVTAVSGVDASGTEGVAEDLNFGNFHVPSIVTNSSLCQFDTDPVADGNQFKLIFTPGTAGYKLAASNPGQFYYNLFYQGDANATVDIELNIPYPFETQGATPIHVYGDVGFELDDDGLICLTPEDEIANYKITFAADEAGGDHTVLLEGVQTDADGFIYVNIHLDYGLKGDSGWGKYVDPVTFEEDALISGQPDIFENTAYQFSASVDDDGDTVFDPIALSDDAVYNDNVFKKTFGVGGLVTDGVNGVDDQDVYLQKANGTQVGMATTDEDGWYSVNYKHTGKAASYTVFVDEDNTGGLTAGDDSASFLLGGGTQYVQQDFVLP